MPGCTVEEALKISDDFLSFAKEVKAKHAKKKEEKVHYEVSFL